MKKNIFLTAIITLLFITGCNSISDKNIRNSFISDTTNIKAYRMEGILKLTNNDDEYEYKVKVNHEKKDKYKVTLINKSNNYEQIILKNKDIYVITPSLNKSFKFQSDWPNNNSQSYLLDSIANDLKKDKKYSFTKRNNDYVFTTKTNYPNNPSYKKQDIILDKNYNLKEVKIKDNKDITYVEFKVTKLDKKAKFSDKDFDLDEITKDFKEKEDENKTNDEETKNKENEDTNKQDNNETKTNETAKIDENVFPLYLPSNTSLTDKETISTDSGERVIMTFQGDNPFILVQETVKKAENLEIVPTYGEPFMLIDTVGSLTDTSYTWTSNGVEYYIVSEVMNQNELLEVAKSINIVSTISEK